MKHNRSHRKPVFSVCAVLLACAALGLLLAGCASLALPDAAEAPAGEDRLAGVFVTTEHLDLFDWDAWLQDNASRLGGGTLTAQGEEYERRLYAEQEEEADGRIRVTFPGVEGWLYLNTPAAVQTDENGERSYVSESSAYDCGLYEAGVGILSDDVGETFAYNAILYYTLGSGQPEGGSVAFYVNPVYRTADGQLYLTAGHGISTNSDGEGGSFSQSVSQTFTETVNGESRSETVKFTATFAGLYPAQQYRFVQLDAAGRLLCAAEYAPDALPETLVLAADADCLLVERYYTDAGGTSHTARACYDRSEGFVNGSLWPDGSRFNYTDDAGVHIQLMLPAGDGSFALHSVTLRQAQP